MLTKIIKVDANDLNLREKLYESADVIKNGGLVVFPTETVYGLGADGTNPVAAAKIYAAKGRPSDNPLIIHVANPADAEKYAYTCDTYYRLAEAFMPGPLTVVLDSRETVPTATRGGLDTVAVRCPVNEIARELIALSGVPIAAPSANLSGSPSPTSAQHVIDDMQGKVDVIIDGGDCDFGLESTIVKVNHDGTLTMLRPGKITASDIESIGITVNVASAVTDKLGDSEVALSPGMKYRHYAPKSDVILLDGTPEKVFEYIKSKQHTAIAVITYSEDIKLFAQLSEATLYDFGSSLDELSQAHRLFAILREVDKADYEVIYAPLPKKQGIGLALYNRMIRAAAYKIIRL